MKQPHQWRFIPLLNLSGKEQMAIDKWLLTQHQKYNHPPTLRFYTWNQPTISLGFSQKKKYPPHWNNLQWHGKSIDIVQRPSGGRGVLHQGDLTYAVISSQFEGNLDEVYRQISQFLIMGWQKLGVNLSFGAPHRQYLKSSNCFALSTNADLIDSQGNKFIGSAQLKKGKFSLQHGSMLLNPTPELFKKVFNTLPPQAVLENFPNIDTIIETLLNAAQEYFNAEFIHQPLSSKEWKLIEIETKDILH
ncbi:lipoyl protein ligase domain-containing protein [Cyanobacterium sp. IPPAS B-1200]|uniref:lipoyl protein ligase domain-containing protein n=1 Tax=Cyanobacterium sp. IPPAS B-1200 TaxID=1562720 RepID=UPI0008526931|nr:biotin/lipoate A/B protein ligase family protein [Cyanobacterium sp. IPPAS B-1200]OEJ78828.1 biotin--protein ligase [Cyanobacterium sp. IPPAS B-1200]